MQRTRFHVSSVGPYFLQMLCCVVVLGGLSVSPTLAADEEIDVRGVLQEYVERPDDTFEWKVRQRSRLAQSDCIELTLTSQTWKGLTWTHRLFLIIPDNMVDDAEGMLVVEGGRWDPRNAEPLAEDAPAEYPREAVMLAGFAQQVGAPLAVLLNVPRQPIFDGRSEDAIIAYTFDKYLNGEDSDWILLLPMVKSAVRAMDAIQAFVAEDRDMDIDRFTVTGASKRGWTSWLTAAVDDRVMGTAPMVIDMLNLGEQLPHQFNAWGEYSNRIHDYTDIDLPNRIDSPRGRALKRIVDPYHYRESLTMPKMVLLGTNDAFWTVDALNLYWDGLEGEKYIVYVPNADHDLAMDWQRVFGGIGALHHHVLGRQPMPELDWTYEEDKKGDTSLTVTSNVSPIRVQLWSAVSDTRDFRKATWTSKELAMADGNSLTIPLNAPDEGYRAYYVELAYARDRGLPVRLSTTVQIVSADDERQACCTD